MKQYDETTQIALVWSIEDVQSLRPELADEQSMEVLGSVKHHHDCTLGVTWETLQYHADRLYPVAEELIPFLVKN